MLDRPSLADLFEISRLKLHIRTVRSHVFFRVYTDRGDRHVVYAQCVYVCALCYGRLSAITPELPGNDQSAGEESVGHSHPVFSLELALCAPAVAKRCQKCSARCGPTSCTRGLSRKAAHRHAGENQHPFLSFSLSFSVCSPRPFNTDL
jgi:hypothetical protein